LDPQRSIGAKGYATAATRKKWGASPPILITLCKAGTSTRAGFADR
jgi:hypothetical protein